MSEKPDMNLGVKQKVVKQPAPEEEQEPLEEIPFYYRIAIKIGVYLMLAALIIFGIKIFRWIGEWWSPKEADIPALTAEVFAKSRPPK